MCRHPLLIRPALETIGAYDTDSMDLDLHSVGDAWIATTVKLELAPATVTNAPREVLDASSRATHYSTTDHW